MKKTKIITSLLAALLIYCSLFTLTACYESGSENGFDFDYSVRLRKCVVTRYNWDGDLNNMDINIPNTFNGVPVTSLSGYTHNGPGVWFEIDYTQYFQKHEEVGGGFNFEDYDSIHSHLNTRQEIESRVKKLYGEDIQFLDDYVFNLHFGSNFMELGEPYEYSEVRRQNLKRFEFYNENTQVRAFSFFVTVDENNKYFYSDDLGRMYYKENDKLVDIFLYHNRDSFPEQGEDADSNKIPERPEDTNLEFWIAQDVSEVDFSEYETAVSMISGNNYLGKGYHSDINNTKGVVIYVVNKYPDDSDGKDCVTSILINDADVTLYGINCDSTFEQFDKAMKSNGYEVKISNPQQNQTVHTASLGKVYITLSVTAYAEQPEQTHYSKMLVIGLQ